MIESRSKGGGRLAALLFAGGRRRQLISIGLGLGALAAAIVALAWNRETLVDSVASLRSASPWTVLALLGGCAAQLLLSGLVFWWLYRRLVPVPVVEMSALIAATNAANFLPLRPGLVGRIAYLRARRAVPLSVSVRPGWRRASGYR